VTEEEKLAAEFERHRPYLHAIAFRVLGSHADADADDAVQEAWLRLARADPDELARFRAAQALVHETEVFLPLTDQLPRPLRLAAVRTDRELHDTPIDLGCCDDR